MNGNVEREKSLREIELKLRRNLNHQVMLNVPKFSTVLDSSNGNFKQEIVAAYQHLA